MPGGRFLLRLEDIDQTRCRAEYAAAILEDLAWLGLDWDGPVRRQSEHFDDYRAALDRLEAMACSIPASAPAARSRPRSPAPAARRKASRAALSRHLPPPRHAATCREAALRRPIMRCGSISRAALALTGPLDWVEEEAEGPRRMPADPHALGDVVLARKEVPTSYHLAVTVDDALQGVTLVTRGEDLARPRISTACCRRCWTCRRRATGTMRC